MTISRSAGPLPTSRPTARAAKAPLPQRLRRLSRLVRGLTLLAVPLVASMPLLWLLAPETLLAVGLEQMSGMNLRHLMQGDFTLAVRVRLALVSLPMLAVTLALLWQLWSLFGEYLKGAVFSPRALVCLRRFAGLLLALSVVGPLIQALTSVAISWDNPPGQRTLMVALSSSDYALVLIALVFMAIARVMSEAARVAEENEQFI